MNDNFNDDNTEINLDDFSITSQYHYDNFDHLYLLSSDNDYTEDFMIHTDLIPTADSIYISVEVQEKVKYGFKFSGCNILNNVGYLMKKTNITSKVSDT